MPDTAARSFRPAISTDKLCFIVSLAREFDNEEDVFDVDAAPDPGDEAELAIPENYPDPAEAELRTFIDELNRDEQIDLVALAWLGRGDGEAAEWSRLRADAATAHNDRTADYLLGVPQLADLLEEGMSAFDLTCEI
jgi:hypothetical protein